MYQRFDDYRVDQNTTCKIYESDYLNIKKRLPGWLFGLCLWGVIILFFSCDQTAKNNLPSLPANSTVPIDERELVRQCVIKYVYAPFLPFVALFALPIMSCFVLPDPDFIFLHRHREQILLYVLTVNGLESKTNWGHFLTEDKLYDPRLLCYINEFVTPQVDINIQN